MFAAMAVEMDPSGRSVPTLPVVPIDERTSQDWTEAPTGSAQTRCSKAGTQDGPGSVGFSCCVSRLDRLPTRD